MTRKNLTVVEVAAVGGLVYIFREDLRALMGTRLGTDTGDTGGGGGGGGGDTGDGNGGGGGGGVARPLTLDGIRRSLRGELR